jgi:hypothetical protein
VILIFGAFIAGTTLPRPIQTSCPSTPASPCLTNVQTGVATVTITGGTGGASAIVSYSPAFSSVPVLHITPQTIFTGTSTVTITSHLSFQSGTDLNWVNMPAADTEIYGDILADHRVSVNWVGATTFRFGYNCPVNSNTVGAYLTVQYSTDGGILFFEVNSAQRAIIDGSVCPNGSGFGSTTYSSIPQAAQVNNPLLLRIIGHGGGGVGDTPRFSELWLEWPTTFTISNVASWRACANTFACGTQPDSGTDSFAITVQLPFIIGTTTSFRFTWSAGVLG